MDLANHTPLPARLFHGHLSEAEKCAWVVARATYHYDRESGSLTLATDDPWPIFDRALETAVGLFPSDNVFVREGCDVVVVGTVRLEREVTRHTLKVRAGGLSREVTVHGDRVWERSARGALAPCPPRPFREMVVDWRRAYGGTPSYEGQAAPHYLNPEGMGFYWSVDDALEKPLANLEDPAFPITRWEERPLPAGFGPITNAPTWHATKWLMERGANGGGVPDSDEVAQAAFTFFEGASPPAMIAPSLVAGDVVEVTGLGPSPMRFAVPAPALRLSVDVGVDRVERALAYSGVWVLAEHDLVVLTARANFRYPMRRRETRVAALETIS